MNQKWWHTFYEMQHQIWPEWSRSDAGADEGSRFILDWLQLQPESHILDLGCGVGREIMALARAGCRCVGVEFSEALVKTTHQRILEAELSDQITVINGDFRKIEFDASQFDLILFWDSTLCILNKAEAQTLLCRAREWTKRHGWLLVQQLRLEHWYKSDFSIRMESESIGPGVTNRAYYYDSKKELLLDKVIYHAPNIDTAVELPIQELHLYSENGFVELMQNAGYSDVDLMRSDGWNWNINGPQLSESPMVCFRGLKS